jgi:hypothetical protein
MLDEVMPLGLEWVVPDWSLLDLEGGKRVTCPVLVSGLGF